MKKPIKKPQKPRDNRKWTLGLIKKPSDLPPQTLLPPREFSNAMNVIYPEFDYTNWQDSKEWKLFNAGRAQAADIIYYETASMATDARQLAAKGGYPKGFRLG